MSNIEKIKKFQKGIYNRPIQVGYKPKGINERAEGEVWEEPSGRKFTLENGKILVVGYPIIPWIGVMSLGYYFGSFYDRNFSAEKR